MAGINGWLIVYLVGSAPLFLFLAAGLSGWYWDYPLWLFGGIFVVLAAPLVMLVMKVPSAPAWNIASLCAAAGLITLRVLTGVLFSDRETFSTQELTIMTSIPSFAIGWAVVWTMYFLRSGRVTRTFA